MRHNYESGKLTIYLEGELNSFTSEGAEKEIDALIKRPGITSIVMDMGAVTYLSSAGIRVMVKLKKQYKDTSLVNVTQPIFDILSMVGLDTVFHIERA